MRRVAINADAEARSSTLRDERNGAECNSFYGNPDPATKEKAPISYESNCSISTRSCPQPYHQRSLSYQNHPPCVTRLSIRHGKRASPCLEPDRVRVRHVSRLTTCLRNIGVCKGPRIAPRESRTLLRIRIKPHAIGGHDASLIGRRTQRLDRARIHWRSEKPASVASQPHRS